MLWLQNANVDLSEVGHPDSDAVQSEILSAWDGIQLRQPVRHGHPLSVSRVFPGDSTRVTGAYDEDGIKWIELPPCIAGKASSLESMKEWSLPHWRSRNILMLHYMLCLTLILSKPYADHQQSFL